MRIDKLPFIDNNSQALQFQSKSQNIGQRGASETKDYDLKEAPVIKLIRMMGLGKNVDTEV
jgi:hypothetical protein